MSSILISLAAALGGYLLRHFNVQLPGLPASPPTSPGSPSDDSHVTRISLILGIARHEAASLLQAAVQAAIAKGLADLNKGKPSAPASPPGDPSK